MLGGSGQEIPSLNHPNIINLCGKLNIRQSVYLTENCDGLVGSNSAMSCVTYSKKIPTVVLTPSYDNLEKGDIIIFPSFLMHSVNSGQVGTTISGNIYMKYLTPDPEGTVRMNKGDQNG